MGKFCLVMDVPYFEVDNNLRGVCRHQYESKQEYGLLLMGLPHLVLLNVLIFRIQTGRQTSLLIDWTGH